MPALRYALTIAWLVLASATIFLSVSARPTSSLLGSAAIGTVAVYVMGRQKRISGNREFFGIRYPAADASIIIAAIGATVAAIAFASLGNPGYSVVGTCIFVLAASYGLSWRLGRGPLSAYTACALAAFAAISVILGRFPSPEARLAYGVLPTAFFFIIGLLADRRYPEPARSALLTGHVSSIIFASILLLAGWSVSGPSFVVPILLYAALYGVMSLLGKKTGFRTGLASWLSLALLFTAAARNQALYRESLLWPAVVAVLWLFLGYILQRTSLKAWSRPLYAAGTIVTALSGLAALIAPSSGQGAWLILLIGSVCFALLYAVLRDLIFAYLLTLSFSLMAYDWVKLSTSHFTRDLLSYLVIGVLVVGLYFIVPHVKRFAAKRLSLPVFSIFNRQGEGLLALCIVALGSLVFVAYALKVTAHPKFCVSCHNMDKFYESWQHSSHKDVACLECHYEPGLQGHVEGKMGAMVQLAEYVSDLRFIESHSGNSIQPHGIVSNKSCLREGCHQGMEDNKETLLFEGEIRFQHSRHLSTHPRGKELNCVSCHGQAVQGQHITVTKTACLTCHFYGRGRQMVAIGTCRTCHPVPKKTVGDATHTFSHTAFLEGNENAKCEYCHSRVTEGDGAVSRIRCLSCHIDAPPKIEDQERFHLVHVSEGHFDCLQCHDEVKHGQKHLAQQMTAFDNCSACHTGQRHSVQEQIYAGTEVP